MLGNTGNTDIGSSIFHSGTGIGLYSQTQGQAVIGLSTGTAGRGGTFQVNNTAANANSIGLFVVYDADGAGGGGGGNAVEVQHNGSIGNAIDVFMGTPTAAPGPANTTSEYSCISASHYATGTGTAGYKSALQASVNGGDPAIISFSNGTGVRNGIMSYANPNGPSDPIAVYGYSSETANPDYGIGVQGVGGYYGVRGWKNGTNYAWTYAVYAQGDLGASGAKTFIIDHPLDPSNKILRHYSIESNEITNMYRGVVELDANGKATVELPEYFDAVNKNVSYQLTAIGTSTQPYVLVEEANNEFVVAGAPNTKVSWTVYGERNDPTIQWYNNDGKNYDQEVSEKPARFKGKYYTPEAYGQPASMGIHYSPEFEASKKKASTIKHEAMPTESKSTQPEVQKIDVKVSPKKDGADVTTTDVLESK